MPPVWQSPSALFCGGIGVCLCIRKLLNGGKRIAFQGFWEIIVERYQ